MTRYADPHTCPDCGAAIDLGQASCTSCALPLRGPLAQELFVTLQQADTLLERLRATSATRVAAGVAPVGVSGSGSSGPHQPGAGHRTGQRPPSPAGAPDDRPSPRRTGLAAPSVPKILLGLGALCLLVAALVFLAVAWAILGVGGRTVVLAAMTAATGGASYLLARSNLRSGAESLAVVAFGLLILDVAGAESAGWLGDLGPGGVALTMGVVMTVLAYGASEVARTTPARRLLAAEVALGVGAALVVLGSLIRFDSPEGVLVVAVLTLAVGAVGARRRDLTVLPTLLTVSAGGWWLVLLVLGLVRATEHHTVDELWGNLEVWPLLAADVLALAVGATTRLPLAARITGATTAATIGVLILALPASHSGTQSALLAWLALLVATAVATYVVPGAWRAVAAVPMLMSAALPTVVALDLLGGALDALAPDRIWHRAAMSSAPVAELPATPYLLVPSLLGLLLAAVAGSRFATDPLPRLRPYAAPLAGAVGVGLLATLVLLEAPLLLVVLGGVLVAAALAGWAVRSHREVWLSAPAALLLIALGASLASTWTTALVLVVLTAAAAALSQAGSDLTRPVSHVALPPALAGLIWTAAEIGGLDPAQRAIPVLLVLGALAVARPHPAGDAVAALSATVAAGAAIAVAGDPQGSLALHLTLAGALVTVTSLVNEERRILGWLGGLLLAMATWVRLEQLGVTAPEPYTLPSAIALLAVGGWHLGRHADASTYPALLPGLGLALVPTLLWALAEPISWRALALGLSCAALVVAGALVRWSAPVVAGGVVGGLLVLREASPFLGSIHPWIVIGLVGTLLTALGVTWESRVREVRVAGAYLRRLR